MTKRKFTPPTKFPAEYVTGDGRKAVILGGAPDDIFIYVGYILNGGDVFGWKVRSWGKDGSSGIYDPNNDLHDHIIKKHVAWFNDYGDFTGHWCNSREDADSQAGPDRISLIRREWVEGQPMQYFMEKV